MSCPSPEALARFADGRASPSDAAEQQAHLDGCAACREVLVALATASRAGPAPAALAPVPVEEQGKVLLGRYEVLETLGAGGMGLVLSARDLKLDRKVALKLVRPDLQLLDEAEQARARLLREAQLMAQVRHPNVVTVYDVGTLEDRIVVSMENVEGESLRQWLKTPRPWRQVVEVFARAGAGLAAAHTAGVVHRDFKPDNVLMSGRGEVFVTDFGLAWSATKMAPSPAVDAAAEPGAAVGPAQRSRVVGTPAYMAPEQLRGERLDGRADQFSFCVALYEALHRERPFEADELAKLLVAIEAGRIRPEKLAVPRWLRELIRRGLSARREDRFPSMEALLARMRRGTRRAGRALLAAGSAVALALAIGYGAGSERPCPDPGPRLSGIWDDSRRQQIERAFRATGVPFADQSWGTVRQAFDAFAGRWTDSYRQACEATRVRRDVPEEVFARRAVCLESRLKELQAFVELFSRADREVVEGAPMAGERLGDLAACESGEVLALAPLPAVAEGRAAIAEARLAVARIEALCLAGKFRDAKQGSGPAVEKAKATGYRPVEAEALLAAAIAHRLGGTDSEAERLLDDATVAAESGRHLELLPLIAAQRVHLADADSKDIAKADLWARRAEAALGPAPRTDLRAEVDMALMVLHLNRQRFPEAEAVSLRAAEQFEKLGRPRRALDARFLLAQGWSAQGRLAEAVAGFEAVSLGRSKLLGDSHPATLRARNREAEERLHAGFVVEAEAQLRQSLARMEGDANVSLPLIALGRCYLSGAETALGKHREAVADARQALALMEADRGKEHGYTARALVALAIALREGGQLTAALEEHERARQVFDSSVRPDHTGALTAAAEHAETQLRAGRPAEALARLERALPPLESKLGRTQVRVLRSHRTRAEALAQTGKVPEALAESEAQLGLARQALGSDHPETARALLSHGRILIAAKRPEAARPAIEEAVASLGKSGSWPQERARGLAQLAPLRRDDEKAQACAEALEAHAWFAANEAGEASAALELRTLKRWATRCPSP